MLISYNWLKYFAKDKESFPSLEELSEKLTLHSYEVESVEKNAEDWILDVDILPNRAADSLSHLGVLREVSAIFGTELAVPEPVLKGESDDKSQALVSLSVEDGSKVSRALKQVVTDVKVGPSPSWLRDALLSVGQRSINNVVDVTNFIMLQTGQPVHAFDLDKIASGDNGKKDIIIRNAKDGEKIILLDGEEYTLDSSMLVISDSEKALDVAGIKGGSEASISEGTTNVLLSVCTFDFVSIRETSRKLKLFTDASKRFQNNLSPELAEFAMQHFGFFMEEYVGGKTTSDRVEYYPNPHEKKTLSITLHEFNSVLGSSITSSEVKSILERLSFKCEEQDPEVFLCTAPFWRQDIDENRDLVEEVGRIYGYDNIKSEQLPYLDNPPKILKSHYYSELLRDLLVERGFSELYLYSFVDKGDIEVKNKIASDKGYLRSSLMKGVSDALDENMKNAPLLEGDALKVFELGTVFKEDREHLSLCIAVRHKTKKGTGDELKDVLKELSLSGIDISGDIVNGSIEVDFDSLILTLEGPVTMDRIKRIEDESFSFEKFSSYPFVLRDVAVWVPEVVQMEEVLKIIKEKGGELLKRVELFDEFKKDGRISYAFKLVFQSLDKTLTDVEVGEVMDEVYAELGKQDGWEIR